MNIVVVTPPPVEPVTIQEAFVHLRLDNPTESNPDFAAVQAQITSAREQCEQITRRAFVQQTLRLVQAHDGRWMYGSSWSRGAGYCSDIELLRPPLISVSAVRYYDTENTLQTVSPSRYFTIADLVPRLRFVDGFEAPDVYQRSDAVQVEYIAGYPPEGTGQATDFRANVPASIKQAILLAVQLQYDELTPDKRKALEGARDALLSSFRIHTF